MFDLGYLGVKKDYPEQLISLPNRKKRNVDPSQEEKEYNKYILKRDLWLSIPHTDWKSIEYLQMCIETNYEGMKIYRI